MLKLIFIFFVGLGYSAMANANNYQDWWINKDGGAKKQMVFSVAQQNDTVLVMGYDKHTGTSGVSMIKFSGDLDATTHAASGTLITLEDKELKAAKNHATITFNDINTATLTYTLNGKQKTISLTRLAYSPLRANGTWEGGMEYVVQCPGKEAFLDERSQKLTVTTPNATEGAILHNDDITIHAVSDQIVCDDTGTISQDGSHLNASGTGSCSVAANGTASHDVYDWEAKDIVAEDFWFVAKVKETITSGEDAGCVINGLLTGVRHTDDITHEFDN
jgi:hypothetical protein